MFWSRRRGNPSTDKPVLRCSFCNKVQHDVRKRIAGPTVCICDECVQLAVDIIADDPKLPADEAVTGPTLGTHEPPSSGWSASAACTLCRMPVVLEEALLVEERAIFCPPCVAAIQEAIAQANNSSADPDVIH